MGYDKPYQKRDSNRGSFERRDDRPKRGGKTAEDEAERIAALMIAASKK